METKNNKIRVVSIDVLNYSNKDIIFNLKDNLFQEGLSVISDKIDLLPTEKIIMLRFNTSNREVVDSIYSVINIETKGIKEPFILSSYISSFQEFLWVLDVPVFIDNCNIEMTVRARKQITLFLFIEEK